jgi:hypothetical protein
MRPLTTRGRQRLGKHVGMAGFTFFFVKGLAWLAAPWVMYLIGAAGR